MTGADGRPSVSRRMAGAAASVGAVVVALAVFDSPAIGVTAALARVPKVGLGLLVLAAATGWWAAATAAGAGWRRALGTGILVGLSWPFLIAVVTSVAWSTAALIGGSVVPPAPGLLQDVFWSFAYRLIGFEFYMAPVFVPAALLWAAGTLAITRAAHLAPDRASRPTARFAAALLVLSVVEGVL